MTRGRELQAVQRTSESGHAAIGTIEVFVTGPVLDLDHTAAEKIGLTARERDVLGHLCLRLTDREIAACLGISPRTVETHVARILAKLGAANRRDAAAMAIDHTMRSAVEHPSPYGMPATIEWCSPDSCS